MKRKKKILIPILAFTGLLLVLILLVLLNGWNLEIDGIGEPEEYLECMSDYQLPSGQAFLQGTNYYSGRVPLECERTGLVDVNKVGDYKILYHTSLLWLEKTQEKLIHVRDTTPPVIQLIPDEREYVRPDEDYQDPGFSASDTVDGDLTGQVRRELREDRVLYYVEDSSGNSATAERELKYSDVVPPELTLQGETEIVLEYGASYEEPGYVATDDRDGDLTDRVVVEGEIGTEAGEYLLTYSVADSFDNRATATRTVTVLPLRQPETVTPNGKVIYLTFDDGPSKNTARLLEILAKYNVKATFFVVNYGYSDMIAEEAAQGHAVGVHSLTHDYQKIYASEDAYFADLNAMNEIVKSKTGSYTKLIRFPGGSSNTVSSFNPGIMTRLTKAVLQAGYQYFDWNVSSGDAGLTTDTDVVYQNVIDGVRSHDVSVVLQHDSKSYSVDAVERIIIWGLENGYTFLPLSYNSPPAHHHLNN